MFHINMYEHYLSSINENRETLKQMSEKIYLC